MTGRLLSLFAAACAALAQTPAFEVASVKQAEPITRALVESGRLKIGVSIDAHTARFSQYSLYDLICFAFQIKGHQLSGPDWMITSRYDIEAKLPEGASRGQTPAMVQTLLADRFGLRYHRENRQIDIYALVVAKGGARLTPSSLPETVAPSEDGQIRGGTAVGRGGSHVSSGPSGDSAVTPGQNGDLHVENKHMTMAAFAGFIGRYCELPVFDRTGLQGAYEMEFDVSGEEVRAAARAHGVAAGRPASLVPGEASEPSPVSLASSLRKLGLKLETGKASAEVVVIDKVERVPTEN